MSFALSRCACRVEGATQSTVEIRRTFLYDDVWRMQVLWNSIMKKDNTDQKAHVLKLIANGKYCSKAVGCGLAKWRIGKAIVHVRFCSNPGGDGISYAFNINPNTLSSDYELWICGNQDTHYLVPIHLIKKMYQAPDGYVDSTHPTYRIVNINTQTHHVLYAREGQFVDCSLYFGARL